MFIQKYLIGWSIYLTVVYFGLDKWYMNLGVLVDESSNTCKLHRFSWIPSAGKCIGWSKMAFKITRSTLPHIFNARRPQLSNFNLFRSVARCFRVAWHFEISALKKNKMTLNTTPPKVTDLCSTSPLESQVIPFRSVISYFQYIAIFQFN